MKRYSSGMMVRLGFAVAAHLDPEILVVDEVLAVGDAEFQKKAIGKMQDVSRGEGRTVLFVSHNMASVQRLCNHGVLLANGMVNYMGNIADTIHKYLSTQVIQSEYCNKNPKQNDKLNLLWAKVSPEKGDAFYNDTAIDVCFRIRINDDIGSLVIGFNIYSSFQHPLARADYNDVDGRTSLEKGEYEFHFRIPAHTFSEGDYTVVLDVAEKNIRNYAGEDTVLSFRVDINEQSHINAFSENVDFKSSIVRGLWLVGYNKVQ